MEKNIKDYLHLYLGCDCMADAVRFKLHGVEQTDTGTLAYDGTMINGIHQCWWIENCDFKPILRPLSDMTEEENQQYKKEGMRVWVTGAERNAHSTYYLLSKHFDLFGLIEAGLAIDKTTLTPSPSVTDTEDTITTY